MLEHCCKCGNMTGHAGKGDDSLYDEEGNGPFCDKCFVTDYKSILKLQESEGFPKKKEINDLSSYEDDEGNEDREMREHDLGFNDCHNQWTAWLAGRVNVNSILEILSEELNKGLMDKESTETILKWQAEAIVKDILGGKE